MVRPLWPSPHAGTVSATSALFGLLPEYFEPLLASDALYTFAVHMPAFHPQQSPHLDDTHSAHTRLARLHHSSGQALLIVSVPRAGIAVSGELASRYGRHVALTRESAQHAHFTDCFLLGGLRSFPRWPPRGGLPSRWHCSVPAQQRVS